MRFADKVILATGVATGLGRVAAELFAREGAKLLLVDYNEAPLRSLVEDLQATGARVAWHVGDVSLPETADAAIATVEAEYGRLDILVNNAGINPVGNIVDTPVDVWDRTIAVNLRSAYLFAARAIPLMERGGGGTIVNTASIASFKASTAEAAYSVSKAGLMQLTRVIAKDFGTRGIRANAVCPGFLPTYMADRLQGATPEQQAARSRRAAELVPMGREGTYEEIANIIAFLASEDSSYMNGAGIIADGGQTV
jgi:NAD(P)-dependent dehydrogenase (short-subunit alcohol dehydrogenase family)